MTGSVSTARPARSSSAPWRPSPPASRIRPSCSRSSTGPTTSGAWACGPTPTSPRRPPWLARYGAQGIGLCRTEHMFREGERLEIVRSAILVANVATRAKARLAAGETLDADDRHAVGQFDAAMAELEVLQQGDFEGIFKAMDGLPVVIRLIDPPLHEFLPNLEEQLVKVTRAGDAATRRGPRAAGGHQVDARAEPDARPARLPPGPDDPRLREDPDAGHPQRPDRRQARGRQPHRQDHDPARRPRERAARDAHASWRPRRWRSRSRPASTSTTSSGP